jgi:hypothetical protein
LKLVLAKNLVFAACLAASSGAFAITTTLSLSLPDPSTYNAVGNGSRDVVVTGLAFTASLYAEAETANGANIPSHFQITAQEWGTMTYNKACTGRACGGPTTVYGQSWTLGPLYNSNLDYLNPIPSFTPGDVLDAKFAFVIPGGIYADLTKLPFNFFLQTTGAYDLLQLTDTTTHNVITPTNGIYSLGTGSYELEIKATYPDALAINTGAGVSSQTVAVAAVPEPATYAMMLAGLGLLGMVGHRQKDAGVRTR